MIHQYDSLITQTKEIFNTFSSLQKALASAWQREPEEQLILPSESAFELGGNGSFAISGIFFTTNLTAGTESDEIGFVSDEVFTSPDRFSMDSSINYAKFVVVNLKNSAVKDKDSQQLYGLFRKLEYVRYHSFLKGFSIRISSSQHREVSRVSKEAVKAGITLAAIGQSLSEAYLAVPEVESVQLYLAAHPKNQSESGAFKELEKLALKSEEITDSMNVIFKGLKMDCSTCGQKELCDEIEGMKDLHKSMLQ